MLNGAADPELPLTWLEATAGISICGHRRPSAAIDEQWHGEWDATNEVQLEAEVLIKAPVTTVSASNAYNLSPMSRRRSLR